MLETPESLGPDGPWIATGTLLSLTFSMMRLPAATGWEVESRAVLIPIAVFVMVESMKVTEPTAMSLWPPDDMFRPTEQLLMLTWS